MAAAQSVGTPAPAAAPTESVSAESHGIDSILGDLSDVAETGADDGSAVLDALAGDEAPVEAEKPETAPDKAQRLDDDVIFSDAALSTKEGVLKAAARAKQLRELGYKKYLELKAYEKRVAKRDQKLKFSIQKHVTSKQNDMLLVNNVRANVHALMSPTADAEAKITALGNLTGMDGVKAYELFTSHIVNRGPSKLDPQVQAVLDAQRQEIEQLKSGLTERAQQEERRQAIVQLGSHAQKIQQMVAASTTTPHVSRFMRDDPQGTTDFIINEITEAHEAGRPLDIRTYFGNLEARLAPHFEAGRAPQGDSGGPAPKQPAPAQRSPLGQSIGPRSTAPATQRVPSEEEALRALADSGEFDSLLGF